jgi:hypothetical protein
MRSETRKKYIILMLLFVIVGAIFTLLTIDSAIRWFGLNRGISNSQLESFSAEMEISPRLVKSIDSQMTAVAYGNMKEAGCYVILQAPRLWSNDNNFSYKLVASSVFTPEEHPQAQEVSVLTGFIRNIEIVVVTINKEDINRKSGHAFVSFSNGETYKVDVVRGIALVTTDYLGPRKKVHSVTIYDDNKNEIYFRDMTNVP